MIDCCSLIFQSGQMPTNMTASVSQKECDVHCLSADWLWLLRPELLQTGQRLTELVRVFSGGLIGKLKAPWASSVKCSPVSHTDTLVFALSTIGSSAVSWKKKKKKPCSLWKKFSPCLVLCSQPELDEYSHAENTSGMQHQQSCLASCIYWFSVIVACFFI